MASLKYYDYQGGIYVENIDGPLMGIEWQDGQQNTIRAILFIMDFSMLQYGHEIPFIYQTEVRANGTERWLLDERKTFKITNDVLIEPQGTLVKAFGKQPATQDPPSPGYVGQMDYFVSLYLKGDKYPPGQLQPMYWWLAEVIAGLEGVTLD